jgi:alpha-beta hydrolase superfamily lysophospholipase
VQNAVIYIHGKDGSAEEAGHYKLLFQNADIIGFDYKAQTPWEAEEEFQEFFDSVRIKYEKIYVIANSIGAFYAMSALSDKSIERAMFISPIVNMEKLIADMMVWSNVTEAELCDKKKIKTSFGETLSYEYLCYVREHPVRWTIPTDILYGGKDHLSSYETMSGFSKATGAVITVMENGDHWFHTEEQMEYLDHWMRQLLNNYC